VTFPVYIGGIPTTPSVTLKPLFLNHPEISHKNPQQSNSSQDVIRRDTQKGKLSKTEITPPLDERKQAALDSYLKARTLASEARIERDLNAERMDVGTKGTSKIKHLVLCGERNERAHKLCASLKKNEIAHHLGKGPSTYALDQAQRHQNKLDKEKNKEEAIHSLYDNMEKLVFELFPSEKIQTRGRQIRIGRKGALAIQMSGSKVGQWKDYSEDDAKGHPLQLIQHKLGLSYPDSIKWAEEFIGRSPSIEAPRALNKAGSYKEEVRDAWQSQMPPKSKEDLDLSKVEKAKSLAQYKKEEARYPYRDIEGKLLFYVVRFVDKVNPKDKYPLPFSYGRFEGEKKEPYWNMKRPQFDKTPLYNQHLLKENPKAKVLIVEGEKTADAAQKELGAKGYIAVSWIGGASQVNKADWSPLKGRGVVIWPDNDKPGKKAAEKLITNLGRAGAKSVRLVDLDLLEKKFPEKWDLADPLPQEFSKGDLLTLVQIAEKQEIAPSKDLGKENEQAIPVIVQKDRSRQTQMEM
jgi:5S rRNA maturation endonuclease (ribonuclease M5)